MNKPQGWTLTTFDTILNYEQPTPYIVKSTEYNDTYKTAVLTAGKLFMGSLLAIQMKKTVFILTIYLLLFLMILRQQFNM